jgi:hypothetical protein
VPPPRCLAIARSKEAGSRPLQLFRDTSTMGRSLSKCHANSRAGAEHVRLSSLTPEPPRGPSPLSGRDRRQCHLISPPRLNSRRSDRVLEALISAAFRPCRCWNALPATAAEAIRSRRDIVAPDPGQSKKRRVVGPDAAGRGVRQMAAPALDAMTTPLRQVSPIMAGGRRLGTRSGGTTLSQVRGRCSPRIPWLAKDAA